MFSSSFSLLFSASALFDSYLHCTSFLLSYILLPLHLFLPLNPTLFIFFTPLLLFYCNLIFLSCVLLLLPPSFLSSSIFYTPLLLFSCFSFRLFFSHLCFYALFLCASMHPCFPYPVLLRFLLLIPYYSPLFYLSTYSSFFTFYFFRCTFFLFFPSLFYSSPLSYSFIFNFPSYIYFILLLILFILLLISSPVPFSRTSLYYYPYIRPTLNFLIPILSFFSNSPDSNYPHLFSYTLYFIFSLFFKFS